MTVHRITVNERLFVLTNDEMFRLNGIQKTRWTIRENQGDAYWQMGSITLPRRAKVTDVKEGATARVRELLAEYQDSS